MGDPNVGISQLAAKWHSTEIHNLLMDTPPPYKGFDGCQTLICALKVVKGFLESKYLCMRGIRFNLPK